MRLVFFTFLLSIQSVFAQVDTLFKQGVDADTIIIKKAPVTVSQQFVVDEYLYKEVEHFFYIKPYISYLYFQNYLSGNEGVLGQAFCYSVREKNSYNLGIDLGYSIKRFNFLLGYSYQSYSEKVLLYKENNSYQNHFVQNHISAKVSIDLNFKKIKIAPLIGLAYNMAVSANTVYPVLKDNVIAFEKTNDFQKSGTSYALAGLELKAFNSKRTSPFASVTYMRSLFAEGNEGKFNFSYTKNIFIWSLGLMIKF
ncbi:MAG: hypothetical protein J7604_23650 [Sporocytophaga sp.]|uniref:hypothetical protein n=1 Tax=Sporocytophaga sp. TaxID=2231183 RepID=UPI001B29E086|nr:hypothetical protein [Sporocytophaga sp.]MBO9703230.1 hypothetical protein [Sporocytophaga sp.]